MSFNFDINSISSSATGGGGTGGPAVWGQITGDIENQGDLQERLVEIDAVAKGATQATSFPTYSLLVDALNDESKDTYRVGQNFYIETLGIPDVWVYSVEETSQQYTYTNDKAIVDALQTGTIQIGYYKIAQLETTKVDLTNYATTQSLTSHTGNTTIHVTANDKTTWNNAVQPNDLLEKSSETWTFTLADGSTVTKKVILGA